MRKTIAQNTEKNFLRQNQVSNPEFESDEDTPKNTFSHETGQTDKENELKTNLNKSLLLLDN